jgi:NAD(P)H-flavin reductase
MTPRAAASGRSLYTPEIATIKRVERLADREKLFAIALPEGRSLGHLPGQFVQVSVLGVGEAPISISSSPSRSNSSFELAVREVGNVTTALHRMAPESEVGIRGPYGSGFPIGDMVGQDVLLVAGGIGLFPLRSLINEVLDKRRGFGRVIILYGAKSPADRMFVDELAQWSRRDDVEFLETVDRADTSWKGNVGVITTLFPRISIDPARTYCVVVGPPVMYRFAILAAKDKGLSNDRIIVSLERRMKCGVGKCGHCQINGQYVCQEGPVFRFSDILYLPEAL